MNSADRKKQRILEYDINPTKCLWCSTPLNYEKRKKKYCDSSCAGKASSKKRIMEGKYNHSISRKNNRIINDSNIETVTPYVKKLLEQFYKKSINELESRHIEKYKEFLTSCIWDRDMSVNDIIRQYHPTEYNQQFYKCLKNRLKIKLRTREDKKILKNKQHIENKEKDKMKKLYWQRCLFKFDVYKDKRIDGWFLLHHGSFDPNDELFLNRDHKYSVYDGWINNIDPDIISHPANCEIISAKENFKKSKSSSITIEELLDLIKKWDSSN